MLPLLRKSAWLGPPAVLFVLILAAWQTATIVFRLPAYLVPSPILVGKAWISHATDLTRALGLTGLAAGLGFLFSFVIGFLVALIFSQSAIIRRSCYPYAIFLQTVPIVALAPLIINWFGFGFQSVVIVSFIIGLFPIITNTTTGLLSVEHRYLELFEIYNATRWQVLWKLRVPHCVPYLIAGARTSSGLSVIGAIVGEFFVGIGPNSVGLGYFITNASGQLKSDLLFASVFTCTVLGLIVFGMVNFVGDRVLNRWRTVA